MIEDFDNILKKRLESCETPVPLDMFERVQQRRKKRKRGVIFYFKNCLSTSIGLGVLVLLAYKFYNVKIANNSPKIAINTAINTTVNEVQQPAVKVNNSLIFEKNKIFLKSNIFKNKIIKNFKSDSYIITNNDILDSQPNLEPFDSVENSTIAAVEFLPETKDTSTPKNTDFNIKNVPILFPKTVILSKKLVFGKKKKVKEKPRSYYYYEFHGSPQIAQRSLDIKEFRYNDQNIDYINLRKASEKNYWAFETGIRIGVQHRSGFSGAMGIKYQQINEVFTYKIPDFAMNAYDSEGAVKGAMIGERFVKTFNRYRFVHIPLGFGYEYGRFKKKQKWYWGTHFGVDVNVLSKYKGNLLNPYNDREILGFSTEKVNITSFRNNVGFSINGDFTVYRKISGSSEVFLATKYAKIMKSITNEDGPISQKYQVIGLEIGLRKKIKQLKN